MISYYTTSYKALKEFDHDFEKYEHYKPNETYKALVKWIDEHNIQENVMILSPCCMEFVNPEIFIFYHSEENILIASNSDSDIQVFIGWINISVSGDSWIKDIVIWKSEEMIHTLQNKEGGYYESKQI